MSVSQSPESESQSPNPAGDESGQINRPTKAETLRRRAAYAFGNLGQSAFYNALSTYFVVYVTSVLFVNVEKALATKLIALITSLIVIIRIAEIFLDPLLGNLVECLLLAEHQGVEPWHRSPGLSHFECDLLRPLE